MTISNKKKIKQEMRRITIIQVAKELFFQKKYSAITMDLIAKRSGITKRTLYTYFPSKLAIFINLFDENLQLLHQQLAKEKKQKLPTDKLILSLVTILFEFTKKNEKFMRLYWTLDSNEFDGMIPGELMSRVRIWTKAIFDELRSVVDKIQSEGLISPDINPEHFIHLISAINKGIFIHTNKERKFEIANIEPTELYNLIVTVLSKWLFKKPIINRHQR